jgi:hypothetical protein
MENALRLKINQITEKTHHEIQTDNVLLQYDFSSRYIRIRLGLGNTHWYNVNRDDLALLNNNLEKELEEQFRDMNNVMHEQLDLYENDYSGHPDNNRPVSINKGIR